MCLNVSSSFGEKQVLKKKKIFDLLSVLLALHIKFLGYTSFRRSQESPTDGHKTLTGLSQVGTQHIFC